MCPSGRMNSRANGGQFHKRGIKTVRYWKFRQGEMQNRQLTNHAAIRRRNLSHPLLKDSDPPRRRRIESDPPSYGARDGAEVAHVNVIVGPKQDTSAVRGVGQLRRRFDLEGYLVEGIDLLENDFEVGMKISSQFVRPEDFESAVVGPRCGEVERTLDICVFPASGLDIARQQSDRLIRHLSPLVTLLKLGKHGQCPSAPPVPGTLSSARISRRERLISRSHVRIGAYEFESGAGGIL